MKVKTEDGRVYTFKLGNMFNCSIQEPEWFPECRAEVFAVFCGPTIEEAFVSCCGKNEVTSPAPKVGDRIFVDFQMDGPGGELWGTHPIVEILGDEEPPAEWASTSFKDMGIEQVGITQKRWGS